MPVFTCNKSEDFYLQWFTFYWVWFKLKGPFPLSATPPSLDHYCSGTSPHYRSSQNHWSWGNCWYQYHQCKHDQEKKNLPCRAVRCHDDNYFPVPAERKGHPTLFKPSRLPAKCPPWLPWCGMTLGEWSDSEKVPSSGFFVLVVRGHAPFTWGGCVILVRKNKFVFVVW